MTVLPSRCCSGYCKAVEPEGDPGTPGKGSRTRNIPSQASGTAGERLRWQRKTELAEVEWSVVHASLGESRQSTCSEP